MKEVKKSVERLVAKTGPWELRKFYGNHINQYNLFMPLSHYLPIAFEIQASFTTYRGIKCSKLPMDAWVYQELIFKEKPTVIIEIGNLHGGSAVMLIDWLRLLDDNTGVIGVDIDHSQLSPLARDDKRILWIEGDAASPETVKEVASYLRPSDRVMVIDDSNHEVEHTYRVLKGFSPLVTSGQYFIVEDTILGTIMPKSHGESGADIAVKRFMEESDDFETVTFWQKWFITCNPNGFLRRR